MSAALAAFGGVVVYPEYDARIERDYAYVVRVWQGSEKKRLVVYNHCEKSALTTRTRGGDEIRPPVHLLSPHPRRACAGLRPKEGLVMKVFPSRLAAICAAALPFPPVVFFGSRSFSFF